MKIKVYDASTCGAAISKVVKVLNDGGIVIFPTDTVYAIGCSLDHPKAMKRLCCLKGMDKPKLSFLCHDLAQASQYVKPLTNATFKMLKQHLPGPFTFILEANGEVPKLVKDKKKTVGIRIPDNDITRALIAELGNPILSTSIHSDDDITEYTTDPDLILEKYKAEADLILDGGLGGVYASTVVDCTGEAPRILRQGKGELSYH